MASHDYLNVKICKTLHRSFCFLHRAVAEIIRCRCKVMMSNYDPDCILRSVAENPFAIIQLRLQNPTVTDRRVGGCGIQTCDDCTVDLQHWIQIRRNDFPVKPVRIHHSFSESIQWHIVIARDHQTRNTRQLRKKRFRSFKLFSLRALSQIAADDDGVSIQFGSDSQNRFTNLWDVGRTKVQIRDLQQSQFRYFLLKHRVTAFNYVDWK